MNPGCRAALIVAACLAALTMAPAVFGDEGMWLFNKPPTEYLQKKYGFDASKKWLEHVQKSSVRFNTGGSGSFVSRRRPRHDQPPRRRRHPPADRATTRRHNYVRDGFYARTPEDEKKSIGLEINVLMDI